MLDPDVFQLIQRSLDGELSPREEEILKELASSRPEVREILEFQQTLRQRTRATLQTTASSELKTRLLSRVRNEQSQVPKGRVFRFSKRGLGLSAGVAAAAMILGLWLGGYFQIEHHHAPILEAAWYGSDALYQQVSLDENKSKLDLRRLEQLAAGDSDFVFWGVDHPGTRADRLAVCNREAAKILEGPVAFDQVLPERASLVAYRAAKIRFKDKLSLTVPHLIYMAEDMEISAFIIPRSHARQAFETLHGPGNTREDEIGFHDCPECNIAVRSIAGGMVVVYISRMNYPVMKNLIVSE